MGLVNIQNTNLENGITNRNAAAIFGSMGHLDPTKFITHMDDFLAPSFVTVQINGYTFTTAGTSGAITAVAESLGGEILILTDDDDNDLGIIQTNTRGFTVAASKRLYFGCKFNSDVVLLSDLVAGLMESSSLTPPSGIFFQSLEASTDIDIVARSAAGQTAIVEGIATIVADEDVTLEFYFDGIDRAYFAVNGTPSGFLDMAGTTLPDDFLGPTIGAITRAAAAVSVQVDYLFASQER
jgi:hypothetical protein